MTRFTDPGYWNAPPSVPRWLIVLLLLDIAAFDLERIFH